MPPDPPPPFDPATARVLLLGAEAFPELDRTKKPGRGLSKPAFRNSYARVKKYLTDAPPVGLGVPDTPAHVLDLFDGPDIGPVQLREVRKFLRAGPAPPRDVLVYYVGHGQATATAYYLCVRAAEPADALVDTALHAQRLVGVLRAELPTARVYLVLDACFAALAVNPHQTVEEADRKYQKELPQRGMTALCSSGADHLSVAPDGWELTLFTRAFLETLSAGGDPKTERVSFRDLGPRVRGLVKELYPADPVLPELYNPHQPDGLVDEWPLFPNPRYVRPAPPAADRLATVLDRALAAGGPAAAARELEGRAAAAAPGELAEAVRWVGERGLAAGAVGLFAAAARADAPDAQRAAVEAVAALGWDAVTPAVLARLQGGADPAAARAVLDGATVYPAEPGLVRFLRRVARDGTREFAVKARTLIDNKELRLGDEAFREEFQRRHPKFEIKRSLGRGTLTDAYQAYHRGMREYVVIRVLQKRFADDPVVRHQFLEVSRRAVGLPSEYSLNVYDVEGDDDRAYIVRAYVPWRTLRDYTADGGRLKPVDAVVLLRNVARALEPYHKKGVWHGGVRPANVFVTPDDYPYYRLGDPSPALPAGPDGTTSIGDGDRLAEIARYTAPEAFTVAPGPGPASDLYALGCVAFELFCGRPPFPTGNWVEVMLAHTHQPAPRPSAHGSPGGRPADEFMMRLLAKDPADRYRTIEAVLEDLERLRWDLDREPPPAAPPPSKPPASPAGPGRRPPDPTPVPGRASAAMVDLPPVDFTVAPTDVPPPLHSINNPPTEPGGRDAGLIPDSAPTGGEWPSRAGPWPAEIGRYVVRKKLGEGGMGTVFLAQDPQLERDVAVKVLARGLVTSDEGQRRFLREARAVAALDHPNICRVYDFGVHDGQPYLTMPFIRGGSLAGVLRRAPGRRLPANEVREFVREVAGAMAYVHAQGFIHRDLKPSNIMLGTRGEPIVMDFGLARMTERNDGGGDDATITREGGFVGTPVYAAPEQVLGERVSAATDVYSLGVVLYELLTGRPPHEGENNVEVLRRKLTDPVPDPSAVDPEVPEDLSNLCTRMMATDPARRPTMGDVAAQFRLDLLPPVPPKAPGPIDTAVWDSGVALSLPDRQQNTWVPDARPPASARSVRSRWVFVLAVLAVLQLLSAAVVAWLLLR